MEFWGVEVKSGKPLKVQPGEGYILHLSQVCLGEPSGKGNESVCLFVNICDKKSVIGTLTTRQMPQQQLDLVFEKDFELSHNSKNSVYFYGYKSRDPFCGSGASSEENSGSDSEEDIPLGSADSEKPESKVKQNEPPQSIIEKSDSGKAKQKVKIMEPNKDEKPYENDDSSSDDDGKSPDSESESIEASDSDTDEDGEDEQESPKKVEPSKKRQAELASKTPGPEKKAKFVTPQKIDGKKGGGHVATPYPSKQAVKAPANQSKPQTPKSGESHPCKSCNRSFNSEQALQSHSKAKHSAGK